MKFQPDFFRTETREGFEIPEMMKRAWAAELEVLEVIKQVCQKNGIRYYACYGTLLGAVRHNGFIPWDDDIDICMLRKDYDRFMEIADDELPKGFAVSGIYAKEPRLWEANSEPQGRVIADEACFPLAAYMDYFHSYPYPRIGIDIFPLDYYPADITKQYELVSICYNLQLFASEVSKYRADGTLQRRLDEYSCFFGNLDARDLDDVTLRHRIRYVSDRIAASTEAAKAEGVADVLYSRSAKSIEEYQKIIGMREEWFGGGTEHIFEQGYVHVPNNPEAVLCSQFGEDYMIPKMFSAEHGYPFYGSQEEAFTKLLRESGVTSSVDEFCRNWHAMNGGT